MESYQIQIIILLISFALATTVLIDGVTHLSSAKSDFADTPSGKVAWTNMMMYEISVPVLSIFGLIMHIMGLHLEFVSYLPESGTEAMVVMIGTAAHVAAWLTMGSVWTVCEVNTMTVHQAASTTDEPPTIIVDRGGPAFCPQHNFLDGGYSLGGAIPKIKIVLAWLLFILTLATLACAYRGSMKARYSRYVEHSNSGGLLQVFEGDGKMTQTYEMDALGSGSGNMRKFSGGGYETKTV